MSGDHLQMDDDDRISLSSTVESVNDSNQEWVAEGILSERLIGGEPKFLIEWTGYGMHDASWEPTSHLSESLLAGWEEKKDKIRRGNLQDFNVQRWVDAVVVNLRRKHARHEKRNALRAEMGLTPTSWDRSLEELIQSVNDYLQDSVSAAEASAASVTDFPHSNATVTRPSSDSVDNNPESFQRGGSEQTNSLPQQTPLTASTTDSPTVAPTTLRGSKLSVSPLPDPRQVSPAPKTKHQRAQASAREKSQPLPATRNSHLPPLRPKAPGTPSLQTKVIGPKQNSQPAENVFSGGKIRKSRQPSNVAANGANQEATLSVYQRRWFEARPRNLGDNSAPPTMPKTLISLDSRTPSSSQAVDSPTSQPPAPQGDLLVEGSDVDTGTFEPDQNGTSGASATAKVSESSKQARNGSRKKSVTWNDNVEIISASLQGKDDDGEGLFVPDVEAPSPRISREEDMLDSAVLRRPPTPPRGHRQQPPSPPRDGLVLNMTKTCLIGGQHARPINLVFTGPTQSPSHSWLTDFQDRYRLAFSHSCTAHDFRGEFRNIASGSQTLVCGFVSAPADLNTLEMLVERLKLGSRGMCCFLPGYSVLLFPAKCEEWEFAAPDVPGTGEPLKYAILPYHVSESDLASGLNNDAEENGSWERWLPRGIGHFSAFDYHHVFPSTLQKSPRHHIFLAFPPGAIEESRLLAHWCIESSKAEVAIYDSHSPGDWSRFLSAEQGAVFIHEDALWKIRRFPRISQVLNQIACGRYAVSIFHRGVGNQNLSSAWPKKNPVTGDVHLKRISPVWRAFLMTPSFIVSQPRQSSVFIEYFSTVYASPESSHRGKLVVPADFEEWLMDLVAERADKPFHRDPQAHSRDMSYLAMAVSHVSRLLSESSDDEMMNPVIFAPTCIDANDEQSLVNWFGCWSVNNIDWCGRFYVLGSSHEVSERFTRHMKPIRYEGGTLDDPDSAVAVSDRDDVGRSPQSLNVDKRHEGKSRRTSTADGPHRLELVASDTASALKDYLYDIHSRLSMSHPLSIYFIPIAYWGGDMAFHLGDIRSVYGTFYQWFDFLLPFQPAYKTKIPKNTCAAFFHTPEGESSLHGLQTGERPRLRPWLAFFRPVNLHFRPWRETELLIWDVGYEGKLPEKQSVREENLAECHRHLMRTVNEGNRMKNPTMPLTKVWVGGWKHIDSQYGHPIDKTLDHLDRCVRDLKTCIPAPSPAMERAGWKLVKQPGAPASPPPPEPMAIDDGPDDGVHHSGDASAPGAGPGEDDAGPLKTLFLPPMAQRRVAGGCQSLCRNKLFKQSMLAQKKHLGEMDFIFDPTMAWYGQQVAEGRDFKHITVDPWVKVFDQLRLRPAT